MPEMPEAAESSEHTAGAVDRDEFDDATAWLRPELIAHCYRMLGSLAEAEDQVQETYLRAWRAFHRFEGRSSVRTWMYRIATNTCLNHLDSAQRRVLPTGLGQPAGDPRVELHERTDVSWLEPLPDSVVWGAADPDPGEAAAAREAVGLAAVAAMQELPPRQRAVLVLRDVLGFSAAETAAALEVSVAAANSALQRARATVGEGLSADGRRVDELDDRDRSVWQRFCAAFDSYDIPQVVSLLSAEATWQMPPFDRYYLGADALGALFKNQCPAKVPGDLRMIPVAINGRPGAGMYLRDPDGVHRRFQLCVLDVSDGAVRGVVGFFDPELFTSARLPAELS